MSHCSGTIKTVCDLEEGIACQVILARTFRNMLSSHPKTCITAHNIILKMNAKLGGVNNKVHQDYNMLASLILIKHYHLENILN